MTGVPHSTPDTDYASTTSEMLMNRAGVDPGRGLG
jgi:hypothetical protein